MKSLLVLILSFSSPSFALVGYSNEACVATKKEAGNMREQAANGVENADTEISANMDCGGHIPWDAGEDVLREYWLTCADKLDQLYKENCDLPPTR